MKILATRTRAGWAATALTATALLATALLVAVSGSLLTACGENTSNDGGASTGRTSTDGGAGVDGAGVDGDRSGVEHGAPELPRSVTYAGWTWSVTEAAVVPAGGDTTTAGSPEARLGLTVTSTLEDVTVTFPVGLLALSDAGGVSVRGERFEEPDGVTLKIDPAGRADTTAVFEVSEDFSLDGATLAIAESDAEPAVLPLAGDLPADPYPIRTDIDAPSHAVTAALGDLLEFRPVAATATVDWGSERAAVGKRWLAVDFALTGVSDSLYAGIFDGDYLDVLVDGEGIGPVDSTRIDVGAGDTKEETFVYEIPVEFSKIELIAGDRADPAATTATFGVDLPELPLLPS